MESVRVESNRVSHDIEGIGTIRAQNGTALETIAGAAAYWQSQYTALAKRKQSEWKGGLLTGIVSTSVFYSIIVAALVHYL